MASGEAGDETKGDTVSTEAEDETTGDTVSTEAGEETSGDTVSTEAGEETSGDMASGEAGEQTQETRSQLRERRHSSGGTNEQKGDNFVCVMHVASL